MRPSRPCARAARRALRRPRRLLHQPACPTGRSGGAPRGPRDLSVARLCRSRRADELRNQALRMRIARSASMPAASSRAPSRRTCRSCRRPSSSWSSTLETAKVLGLDRAADAARARRRGDRMKRREFITLLGGAAALAARGARAAAGESCRPSGSWARARLRPGANGPPPSCSGCANSAGSRAAPSRSSIAGRRDAASASPRSRPSSSGSRSMSSSRGNTAVLAAKQATSVIPIVFAVAGDPVGSGLVASLARPGGNVTGLSIQATDLAGKRLELLREVVPGLRRLAIMANVGNPAAVLEMGEVQAAARTLGLEVVTSRNPASGGYRARLRGAQGPRGGALRRCRPAREHQPGSHQHLGARRATADDLRASGSTSKREV